MNSHWKKCKLGDVAVFQRGHDLPKTEMKNGNIPVAGSNGVIGYHNTATTIGPGITIGRSGNIGTPKFYKTDFWAHNTVLYVKDFKRNDEKFVYYFLNTFDFAGFNAGSAVPTLNRNHIHEIPVRIPPLPEQLAIAGVLSSLDDKIDLLHRQNKTLEGMAEALWRKMFVEEVKTEWKVGKLGDVIKTTSGGTPSRSRQDYYENGQYKWVKSKELQGTFIIDTEEKITEEALNNSSAKLLPKGSLLLAMYGATVGEHGILTEEATCNQAVCALIPNENYPYTFIHMFLKMNKEEIINHAVGSAQQNISQIVIQNFEVVQPNPAIIQFHKSVEGGFEKIKSNIFQIRTLSRLRDTLLPKLMSGEVRVRGMNRKR